MCLITTWKKPRLAREDIKAFKALKYLTSPYNGFSYKIGRLYETEMEESDEWSSYDDVDTDYLDKNFGKKWNDGKNKKLRCIGPGFHSALYKERLHEFEEQIHRCIIPKGSKYYKDATGLIVSNRIIIHKMINREQKVAKRQRSVASKAKSRNITLATKK